MIKITATKVGLFTAIAIYLVLAIGGSRYGLPHASHLLSYNCDETTWLEALSRIKPNKLNPAPELITPTFYLELYGAAVAAGTVTGWIPRGQSKEWFRDHPDQFARLYLAGRYLQMVCGVLLLYVIWWISNAVWNSHVALIATFLMTLSPGFIAASHFSQASLPVALFGFIGLGLLELDAREFGETSRYLWGGALAIGLAISTKYSAMPLAVILLLALVLTSGSFSRIAGALFFLTMGLFIGTPFAFLEPHTFIRAFQDISRANLLPIESSILEKLLFPVRRPLAHAMGIPFAVFSIAALIWDLRTSRGQSLMAWWLILFYGGILAAGYHASPARVLIAVPALAIVSARWIDSWKWSTPKVIILSILLCMSALPTMAIVSLHRRPLIQDVASQWIDTHLPSKATIGIPRNIYWWTPSTVYASVHHPERLQNPFQVYVLNCSVEETLKRNPEFLLVSGAERANAGLRAQGSSHFFDWVDSGSHYTLIHRFPRTLAVGQWVWNRPEYLYYTEDDLWAPTIDIYQRVNR